MQDTAGGLRVEVPLPEFLEFLKASRYGAKLGKRNIARETVDFRFDGSNLRVTVLGVDRLMCASGAWSGTVSIALSYIGRLRQAPPSQDPLTFSYVDSKLKIGTTTFPAQWAP